ncbi:DUF3800 domain-containing protein [Ruegeria atlantica]|uniref:DUF3800 domain-containing protein n=1 Tax=Ruegeria atlantica TaxID=81569 RepID=UPI002495350C|nr:DUF3800 domain-containing protein [Ruegeria atlantica]
MSALAFIDESGDPGFKLDKGSSQVFVLCVVVFKDAAASKPVGDEIAALMGTERVKPEWKFSKTRDVSRDAFFEAAAAWDFQCRSVVVQKEEIISHHLRTKPRRFYNYFTKMMFEKDGGLLKGAKVVLDGSGDRRFRKELVGYMRRELPKGSIKKFDFRDSRKDPLVQLADMCADAIARSYSDKRRDGARWRTMLERSGCVSDVWEFK